VTFDGKSYQWTQTLDIPAGRDVVLELTVRNAEIGAPLAPPASPGFAPTSDTYPSLILSQWKDSVVSVWTPQSRASGFVIDSSGLVVTNQGAIGSATAVEVQLTPSTKVAARVLVADRTRDVAVLWIDPAAAANVRPVPLDCADASKPSSFEDGQRLTTVGAPLRGEKDVSLGKIVSVDAHASVANVRLEPGSVGGPVFNVTGRVVGLSSAADRDARVVPVTDVCEMVTSAEKAKQTTQPPVAARLPVEPQPPIPADALDAEVKSRAGSLNAYSLSSSEFDVALLTPVLVKAAKAADFGDWSNYFADAPRVVVVRATPKMAESLWTKFARGAAYTQGMALPPIKHFKPGFLRLQAFCGDVEVTPIHPFVLDRRVSETDAVREGLYVFDPQALGPQCASVKLVLYSEKAQQKPDTQLVDRKIIDRIAQDVAAHP
jgi:S1-C subfamily serine protease